MLIIFFGEGFCNDYGYWFSGEPRYVYGDGVCGVVYEL